MGTRAAPTSMGLYGASTSAAHAQGLQQFYHSLFRLQDDVFAGRHPRIQLPSDVLDLIARVKQQAATATPNEASGTLNDKQSAAAEALPAGTGSGHLQQRAATSTRPPASSSAFDPVLLTKSHELVSAEFAMKRQRVEQALADQVAASKPHPNARAKDFASDYDTSLDVDAAWDQAKMVIQHQSAWSDKARSESSDENDYYSSQAMSWSTEHTDVNGTEAGKAVHQAAGPSAIAPVESAHAAVMQDRAQTAQQVPLPSDYDDLPDEDDEDDYSPPPPQAILEVPKSGQVPNQQVPLKSSKPASAFDSRYEYNRPTQQPANHPHVIHSHIREPFMPQPARVSPLALGNVPVLEQPQLLQPPTVPIHQAVQQPTGESGSDLANNDTTGEQSPDVNKESLQVSRKRKKREERAVRRQEKRVKRNAAKQAEQQKQVGSPEPYIKPEPRSPPPFASFAEMAPPPKRRVIDYADDDIQVLSPYAPRVTHTQRQYADFPPPPPGYRYAEPVSPQRAFVQSPGPARRIARDDQDLRRVASLQHASRPYTPGTTYPHQDRPASVFVPERRAVSHVYHDREPPVVVTARQYQNAYRQPSVHPQRYVRDRSRSPGYDGRTSTYPTSRTLDHLQGPERIASPAMMPPPMLPTRIVEDKYGNRYYATPAPPDAVPEMRVRESVPPHSRYYDDYAPPAPLPSSLPPAPLAPPQHQHQPWPNSERPSTRMSMMPPPSRPHYDDGMPPPPMPVPQRRNEDDAAVEAYRKYRQRETSMRPPEFRASTAARDDFPRQHLAREQQSGTDAFEGRRIVSYDDSHSSPRHPVTARDAVPLSGYAPGPRAYSVRPDQGRPDPYDDLAGPPLARNIPRYGTAMGMASRDQPLQMPWNGTVGGGHGENTAFTSNRIPREDLDRGWAEADERHAVERRTVYM